MANRSYLYTCTHIPSDYDDRPDIITGLSEFAYDVPTAFLLMVSDATSLCGSLLFKTDAFDVKALAGRSTGGFDRLTHLIDCMMRSPDIVQKADLEAHQKEMLAFLPEHRQAYTYLEVAEVDNMTEEGGEAMLKSATRHMEYAAALASIVDNLTPDKISEHLEPGGFLHNTIAPDGTVDNMRDLDIIQPLGVVLWTTVLYFAPWDKQAWQTRNDG